jgi:hypothetical protein
VLWAVDKIELKSDAGQRAKHVEQSLAWLRVQTQNQTATMLRNRVNDCSTMKTQTPMERSVCTQYKDEYVDAMRKAGEYYTAAMALGKE